MANYSDESVISYGSKANPKRKPTAAVMCALPGVAFVGTVTLLLWLIQ